MKAKLEAQSQPTPLRLEAKELQFNIAGRSIISGASFEVITGEVLGLIGPNGAGKSTLLRLVAGLLNPASGKVRLEGQELARYSPRQLARQVATVPQTTVLDFGFTCLEVVLMGRSPHLGRFETENTMDYQIAREALATTGTAHLEERAVPALSGGERQLVFVARALAQQPRLLLLDEPISNLDINHQLQVLELARHLSAEGVTVITALHDLNLAARFCQRLLLLAEGQVLALGTPEEVLTAENLKIAYRVEAEVGYHPTTGAWSVTALARLTEAADPV